MDSMLPAILNKSSLLPIEFLSGNLVTRCMYEIAEFQSADELVEKGHKERKAKRYRNALELYEKALTVDPRHEFALFWAGFCLLPTKEWKAIINELYGTRRSLAIGRSIGYYQKLLHIVEEKRPEDVETMGNCYVNIGVGYNLLDDAAKAEKCWQKAIDLNEDDFAYCYLGWFRKRMGREDEAIVLLNKAIAKNERYAVPYFRLGKIRIERKERHLALRCFTNYLRYVDKTDPWIQEEISFAEDYIEVHNPPSEILLEVAKKRWKEKEAKMETPVKNDTTSDPGTAIESGKPHTVQDEKELHELFITCWDQSVGSSSYKKSSWKEMREFFWRFGWRV